MFLNYHTVTMQKSFGEFWSKLDVCQYRMTRQDRPLKVCQLHEFAVTFFCHVLTRSISDKIHLTQDLSHIRSISRDLWMLSISIVGKSVFASGNRFLRQNFPNIEEEFSLYGGGFS